MSINIIILLSILSYFITSLLVYNTESFILLLAFSILFILIVFNKKFIVSYDKEQFRYNELIRFFNIIKIWYRIKMRENDVKSLLLLNLSKEIMDYKINFIHKLFVSNKLKIYEYNRITQFTTKRLEKFREDTFNNTSNSEIVKNTLAFLNVYTLKTQLHNENNNLINGQYDLDKNKLSFIFKNYDLVKHNNENIIIDENKLAFLKVCEAIQYNDKNINIKNKKNDLISNTLLSISKKYNVKI